jgi:hypothetical protein
VDTSGTHAADTAAGERVVGMERGNQQHGRGRRSDENST